MKAAGGALGSTSIAPQGERLMPLQLLSLMTLPQHRQLVPSASGGLQRALPTSPTPGWLRLFTHSKATSGGTGGAQHATPRGRAGCISAAPDEAKSIMSTIQAHPLMTLASHRLDRLAAEGMTGKSGSGMCWRSLFSSGCLGQLRWDA